MNGLWSKLYLEITSQYVMFWKHLMSWISNEIEHSFNVLSYLDAFYLSLSYYIHYVNHSTIKNGSCLLKIIFSSSYHSFCFLRIKLQVNHKYKRHWSFFIIHQTEWEFIWKALRFICNFKLNIFYSISWYVIEHLIPQNVIYKLRITLTLNVYNYQLRSSL